MPIPIPTDPNHDEKMSVSGNLSTQKEMRLSTSTWNIAPEARTMPFSTKVMPRNGKHNATILKEVAPNSTASGSCMNSRMPASAKIMMMTAMAIMMDKLYTTAYLAMLFTRVQ